MCVSAGILFVSFKSVINIHTIKSPEILRSQDFFLYLDTDKLGKFFCNFHQDPLPHNRTAPYGLSRNFQDTMSGKPEKLRKFSHSDIEAVIGVIAVQAQLFAAGKTDPVGAGHFAAAVADIGVKHPCFFRKTDGGFLNIEHRRRHHFPRCRTLAHPWRLPRQCALLSAVTRGVTIPCKNNRVSNTDSCAETVRGYYPRRNDTVFGKPVPNYQLSTVNYL